eukprot:s1305_g16.t1
MVATEADALRYYHTAEKGPSLMYVTDGGDCTGVYQLLRRRSARILLVLAASDPDDQLNVLRETMRLASDEKLASFYDPRDPRRDASYVWSSAGDEERKGYDIQTGSCQYGARLTGRLFVVKNRLPPSLEQLPPEPLLTEEDILSKQHAWGRKRWQDDKILQADLAGCLTPQLFSGLCRLGYRLSGDAVNLIAAEGPLEEDRDLGGSILTCNWFRLEQRGLALTEVLRELPPLQAGMELGDLACLEMELEKWRGQVISDRFGECKGVVEAVVNMAKERLVTWRAVDHTWKEVIREVERIPSTLASLTNQCQRLFRALKEAQLTKTGQLRWVDGTGVQLGL